MITGFALEALQYIFSFIPFLPGAEPGSRHLPEGIHTEVVTFAGGYQQDNLNDLDIPSPAGRSHKADRCSRRGEKAEHVAPLKRLFIYYAVVIIVGK